MPATKGTLRWYEDKIERNTITLEELDEYRKKIDEELNAAKKRQQDLLKKGKQQKQKYKEITKRQLDKKAAEIGDLIIERLGEDVTIEDVAGMCNRYFETPAAASDSNDELRRSVKQMLEQMAAYTLRNGGSLYSWTQSIVGADLMEKIAAEVELTETAGENIETDNAVIVETVSDEDAAFEVLDVDDVDLDAVIMQ